MIRPQPSWASWSVTLYRCRPERGKPADGRYLDHDAWLLTRPSVLLASGRVHATKRSVRPDGYVHAEGQDDPLHTTIFARDFAESCTGSGAYTWVVSGWSPLAHHGR